MTCWIFQRKVHEVFIKLFELHSRGSLFTTHKKCSELLCNLYAFVFKSLDLYFLVKYSKHLNVMLRIKPQNAQDSAAIWNPKQEWRQSFMATSVSNYCFFIAIQKICKRSMHLKKLKVTKCKIYKIVSCIRLQNLYDQYKCSARFKFSCEIQAKFLEIIL